MAKKPDGGWILPPEPDYPRRCICIPVPDQPEHRQAFFGALMELGWQHNWQRDPDHKAVPVSVVWNKIVSEAMERFYSGVEYMCFSCEELNACLAPLYAQITELQEQVNEVRQAQIDNATSERSLTQTTIEDEICGGANAIVDAMHQTFVDTYEATEAAPLDNFAEFIVAFLQAVPIISELPFDEMIAAVNWYFENQFAQFESDFDAIRSDMVCDLKCFVEANDNTFDWDLWADWLTYVGEKYPTNRAAQGFARYSPYRQTWLNQIAALINKDASLQSYFDTLASTWESGLMNPMDCSGCACPACYTWDFSVSDGDWTLNTGAYEASPWTMSYNSVVVGSERILDVQYDFATPVFLDVLRFLSNHADMYVTIETNIGTIVSNEYHPSLGGADENFEYTIVQDAVEWVRIHFRRDVPDSVTWLRSASIEYSGDEPTGGEPC